MRVFIPGDGVSKSCGGSLADDLLTDVVHQCKKQKQPWIYTYKEG